MWRETAPKMVEMYENQLNEIIEANISKNIVVEDMSQWEPIDSEWRKRSVINGCLWPESKGYDPFKHQYESWNTLLKDGRSDRGKSMVVTTGTGSGKTECFMIPLIHDLAFGQDKDREQGVEAIFLYPLNALMENQKDRISEYIGYSQNGGGRNVTFAVYNGTTPETNADGDRLKKYEVGDRTTIRREKPNILLTNPSMLEYMLLREKDSVLFSKSLKWIVIDETHTFKGSAGAELALLLRRVLDACGKKPNEIRFATSSATIGNSDDALKQFITDITGQSDVEIIKGVRTTPKVLGQKEANLLHSKNFVLLDELIPGGVIEEKLEKINSWADDGLKVRLHYYIKSLNQGLYVDLEGGTTPDGKFKLLTKIPLSDDGNASSSVLNAHYCTKCGAVLGRGVVEDDGTIHRDIRQLAQLDSDSFAEYEDDDSDNTDASVVVEETNKLYVGVATAACLGLCVNIENGKLHEQREGKYTLSKVSLKKDGAEEECPCCGAKGAGGQSPIRSFHMSSDFLGRLIAPMLLQQSTEHKNAAADPNLPSEGRKFITFVDSRQSAAHNTLMQNLETEDVWVTSVLYRELFKRLPLTQTQKDALQAEALLALKNGDNKRASELLNLINANDDGKHYITWQEAIDALLRDSNCESMFLAFAVKEDEDYQVSLNKYALSALYRVMYKRPGGGKNSPENWGLIVTDYPQLREKINATDLPAAVVDFNELLDVDSRLTREDWYNYIKFYIDYYIRTNEKMYFKLYVGGDRPENTGWRDVDIKSIRSYRTEDQSRRPIETPRLGDNRWTLLLCRLLGKNAVKELTPREQSVIQSVINTMEEILGDGNNGCGIISTSESISWRWNNGERTFEEWKADKGDNDQELKYMNLSRISFKLYDQNLWFDPIVRIPLDITFKGYSPYKNCDTNRYDVRCEELTWSHFDCEYDGDVREWFEQNRSRILHKWTGKLERILDYIRSKKNTIYIQAEHTAQVPRSVIEKKTQNFIDGKLNIMACSTTMEMGVDIGDLDLVVMNNVPPYPANYKQRAGRAGRAKQNKSACITFCGSDAIGTAVMTNPMGEIINREVLPPKVDLLKAARQMVQRHINSLLLREFVMHYGGLAIGCEGEDDRGSRICDFFSAYVRNSVRNTNNRDRSTYGCVELAGQREFPGSYQSIVTADVHNDSIFRRFCAFLDWLQSTTLDDALSQRFNRTAIIAAVTGLKRGTIVERESESSLIDGTKRAIISIAEDINTELEAIKSVWNDHLHLRNNHPWNKGIKYYWNFVDILGANLMNYLSNHQFTPNANMPIGIIELLIDESNSVWKKTENPTRDLRTALSEYTPGKRISSNGRVYLIGGIRRNKTRPIQDIRKCNNGHTWTTGYKCPYCNEDPVEWANFGYKMGLITPTGYYVSDVSRKTRKEFTPTNIGVQLIGAGDWRENDSHKLIMWRTNEDETNSQILYFDMGQHGYGYLICGECGYAVPAPRKFDRNRDEDEIIRLMYYEKTDRDSGNTQWVHNFRGECKAEGDDLLGNIWANIVLGGTIQTDYCELALFDPKILPLTQMQATEQTRKIGNTLGILLCSGLAKRLGCDRGELDFVTRDQNGKLSICIFDVAKGGSGRSKQLPQIVLNLLDEAREKLNGLTSIDQILDRESMRYIDFVDVKATKEWLDEEFRHRVIKPDGIPAEAQLSSYYDIENDVIDNRTSGEVEIYVDGSNIDMWNYRAQYDADWKSSRGEISRTGSNHHKLIVLNGKDIVAVEHKHLLTQMRDWAVLYRAPWQDNKMIPIARVNDRLYVTSNSNYARLDENWGGADVWVLPSAKYPIDFSEWTPIDDSDISDGPIEIRDGIAMCSDALYDTLLKYSNNDGECIKRFVEVARGTRLEIEYTDKYLTSQLGMNILGQFISRIISEVGCGDNYSIVVTVLTDRSRDDMTVTVDDVNRKLWSHIVSYDKKSYLSSLLAKRFGGNFCVQGICRHENMPHYRRLKVSSSNGAVLYIMPDGGLEFGWKFDKYESRNNDIKVSNCDMNTKVWVYADATGGILYHTALKLSKK